MFDLISVKKYPLLHNLETIQTIKTLGGLAVKSLDAELMLSPKPGLVSPIDSGSHDDMDIATFKKSIKSLENYFYEIGEAGYLQSRFSTLQALGIKAEKSMLEATEGINTHRGAIFTTGLLTAAAGWQLSLSAVFKTDSLGKIVAENWGEEIIGSFKNLNSEKDSDLTHGLKVAQQYGYYGARFEAYQGFPTLFNLSLPLFNEVLDNTDNIRLASIQTLFTLIKYLPDTNLLYRGGRTGLTMVQQLASGFLKTGGVYQLNWEAKAWSIHKKLIEFNLSPGGSADLLSATCFLHYIQKNIENKIL